MVLENAQKLFNFISLSLMNFGSGFRKMEHILTLKNPLKTAENMHNGFLDTGRYDWHIAEPNDLTATLYENLPEEDQYKIGHSGCNRRWSKWTVDEILAKDGWEPNEVYWFSLHKDDTYCYQLILKEGSYVCREYYGNDHKFYTLSVIDGDVKLPDWSSWVEIPNLKVVA